MGLRTICTEGYAVSNCRCTKDHRPYGVVECHPGHLHKGVAIRPDGTVLKHVADDEEVAAAIASIQGKPVALMTCPRCGDAYTHLHGGVCGFCADQLEEIDRREATRA